MNLRALLPLNWNVCLSVLLLGVAVVVVIAGDVPPVS